MQLILECIDQLTVRYVLHTSAKNYVSMTVRAHENAHDGPTIGQFDFQILIEPTLQLLVMFRNSFHLKKEQENRERSNEQFIALFEKMNTNQTVKNFEDEFSNH